jgi:hypothetical protein
MKKRNVKLQAFMDSAPTDEKKLIAYYQFKLQETLDQLSQTQQRLLELQSREA